MQVDFAAKELTVKLVYYGPALSGKTTNLRAIHWLGTSERVRRAHDARDPKRPHAVLRHAAHHGELAERAQDSTQAVHRAGPGDAQRDTAARAPGDRRRRVHRGLPAQRGRRQSGVVPEPQAQPRGERNRSGAYPDHHSVQQTGHGQTFEATKSSRRSPSKVASRSTKPSRPEAMA